MFLYHVHGIAARRYPYPRRRRYRCSMVWGIMACAKVSVITWWDERMIDFLIYCAGHEVFIYLAVDLPQAATSTSTYYPYSLFEYTVPIV
jgi:hypothetical protein